MSESVLPLFSSKSFIVSGLTFRSLIHLKIQDFIIKTLWLFGEQWRVAIQGKNWLHRTDGIIYVWWFNNSSFLNLSHWHLSNSQPSQNPWQLIHRPSSVVKYSELNFAEELYQQALWFDLEDKLENQGWPRHSVKAHSLRQGILIALLLRLCSFTIAN